MDLPTLPSAYDMSQQSVFHSYSYIFRGEDYIHSGLQWGPTVALNRGFKTFGFWFDRRGSFANDWHNYTLEWTSDFL